MKLLGQSLKYVGNYENCWEHTEHVWKVLKNPEHVWEIMKMLWK